MSEKACIKCHIITETKECPICNGREFTDKFTGVAIIFNPEKSEIAKELKTERKGAYALRIRK
ncbi:MAG: hypothetical protein GOU97_00565 [Nanoarchaeota archaeon]|nr:hypothetical protein [Nanoarchaeota archaeon]